MIKIMADSTCDLTQEVLARYNISTAPLLITLDGVTYRDKLDLTSDQLFERMATLKQQPSTAMPAPAAFLEIMETAVTEGYGEILCICMSSGTSGSYQAAVIAKDLFMEMHPDTTVRIHVVDSRGMSHGSGYLILKVARLRDKGLNFDELVSFCEMVKLHVKHYLSVDDLDHLIRSGRLTNASAIIGKLLGIKPIMSMRSGKGAIVAKERGRRMVLTHYVSGFIKRMDPELTDFIIIGYTSDRAYAENLRAKLIQESGFSGEILLMQMGVAVGIHVGLGAISMFFFEKDRAHDGLITNEVKQMTEKRDELLRRLRGLQ